MSQAKAAQGNSIAMAETATLSFVLRSRNRILRTWVDCSFTCLGLELDVIADIDSLPTLRQVVQHSAFAATGVPC